MLKRVLEVEVMDTPEEARDYDEMDHTQVNRLFVDDLLAAGGDVLGDGGGDVLDLGTGTAQIPIELCSRNTVCRVMAVDAATAMLDVAILNIEIAGLRQRILLDRVDAKALPYDDGRFDVVMSNSIVHHIPEPLAVVREAVRVLAPGGLLFFRDLLRPARGDEVNHLVQTYAGQESDHARQMFEDSLRAALNLDEVRQLAADVGFDPQDVEATSDRHWTWRSRKPGERGA